ncbi:MAG: hypothetical protein EU535_00135 [Promethearchaeota archaeon]|nr:MAG: hypothetical protein EU535_00135 [Candidatus Lokiarchaeota archaeon]
MVIYQLDTARIIQVYIVQGLIGVFFLYLTYLILKRDTKRLNIIFSCFYIIAAAGVFINFIYAPLTIESVILVLYYITIFCFLFAPIFLIIVELILLKSEKVITTKKQILLILIYGVLLFGMVFIPNGVTINASTNWKPVWSIPYFVYTVLILSIGAVIPGLYFSVQIYHQFEDEKIKKKWGYFMIGIIGLYVLVYGTLISNTLNNDTFRLAWSIVSLILITIPPYMLYYGIGKQIEK